MKDNRPPYVAMGDSQNWGYVFGGPRISISIIWGSMLGPLI